MNGDRTDKEKLDDAIESLNDLLDRLRPPPSVLVVEDDDNDWAILQRSLKQFRCAVTRVEDGEKAVNAIKTGKFDIILLDQKLPKMAGEQVLAETTGMRGNAKVLLVTGYPSSPQASKVLAEGAILTIPKPVQDSALSIFLKPYAQHQ
jgi:Response regulator containing CheY-like receiver, AAA-type ATPase, and DNA-binding domains